MGKHRKSELDVLRDSITRNKRKTIRKMVNGPYVCPQCELTKLFGTKFIAKEGSGKSQTQKNYYVFKCQNCGFKYEDNSTGVNDMVLDAYNRLVDSGVGLKNAQTIDA